MKVAPPEAEQPSLFEIQEEVEKMFLRIVAVAFTLVIAFYTVLFGWDNFQQKNYSGAVALVVLALTIAGLPVYLLFFKG